MHTSIAVSCLSIDIIIENAASSRVTPWPSSKLYSKFKQRVNAFCAIVSFVVLVDLLPAFQHWNANNAVYAWKIVWYWNRDDDDSSINRWLPEYRYSGDRSIRLRELTDSPHRWDLVRADRLTCRQTTTLTYFDDMQCYDSNAQAAKRQTIDYTQ